MMEEASSNSSVSTKTGTVRKDMKKSNSTPPYPFLPFRGHYPNPCKKHWCVAAEKISKTIFTTSNLRKEEHRMAKKSLVTILELHE